MYYDGPQLIAAPKPGSRYHCPAEIVYRDPITGCLITCPAGYDSDGSSGGVDVWSDAWWIHDVACDRGTWDDGTPISNWDASRVLGDILANEGRWIRRHTWRWATWLFGGGRCRVNGMR